MVKMEVTPTQEAPPVADVLARLPLFEGADPAVLERIASRCDLEHIPASTLLLGPRHPKDRVYVIAHGQVEIRVGRHAEQVIAILGPDQCVGEMSVIESAPPSANVVTRTECTVVAIDGDTFRGLLESSTSVSRNLLRMLARRVRKDNLILRHSLERQAASAQHARLDSLTGLFNRRWLDENLPDLVQQHHAQVQPLTLLMFDIDRFKSFNDTFGHLSGDQALIAVARTLQSHIRNGDQVARFGGEEFVLILPLTATTDASHIAGRLRHAIRRTLIIGHEGTSLPGVTVSIGLAECVPGEPTESLLARADAALYQAKQSGRNRLVISSQHSRVVHDVRIPRLRRQQPHG